MTHSSRGGSLTFSMYLIISPIITSHLHMIPMPWRRQSSRLLLSPSPPVFRRRSLVTGSLHRPLDRFVPLPSSLTASRHRRHPTFLLRSSSLLLRVTARSRIDYRSFKQSQRMEFSSMAAPSRRKDEPRRFAPLNPEKRGVDGVPRLRGVVFDVDGTLCE